MASRLNPYVNFRGEAREALTFYQEVFGGVAVMHTFGDFGMEGPEAGKIMHGMLETPGGYTLMCSDVPDSMELDSGSSITISLSGDDDAELRGYWEKLSAGGTVTMPLERQAWGDDFGEVTDRFGVRWMVNIAGPQN